MNKIIAALLASTFAVGAFAATAASAPAAPAAAVTAAAPAAVAAKDDMKKEAVVKHAKKHAKKIKAAKPAA